MTIVEDGPEPVVRLERWAGPWPDDDPDANFKADVAAYSLADPLGTLGNLATNLDIPVGALVKYVVAKWASGGAEAVLELGPSTVGRMASVVAEAEEAASAESRVAAYDRLKAMVGWLDAGMTDAEAAYPNGGADFRKIKRIAAYGLVTDDSSGADRILLCRIADGWESAGSWTLPGGGIDHGEDPADACRREVEEETGLPPTLGDLLGVDSKHLLPHESAKGDDYQSFRLIYRATVPLDQEPRPEEDESTDLAAWIDRADLEGLPLVDLVEAGLKMIGWR